MEYQDILKVLAPCGLNCGKCFAFADGDIRQLSTELRERLGSFDIYAERFSSFLPVFENYPQFKDLLDFLAQGGCQGCRKGMCVYPNCGIIECYQAKGVDFCFQCDDFPCDHSNLDPHLHRRWILMNERMREIGVERYYEETKDIQRYR